MEEPHVDHGPGSAPPSDPSAVEFVIAEHIEVATAARTMLVESATALADDLCQAIRDGGKLVVFGNGGSAADAQHFAAEFVGHFLDDRPPLPAIALTVDTSALSAIANDYGYEEVFARQVQALCSPRDVVVGISTSGNAESVVRGVLAAKELGARTWAFTGGSGGRLAEIADRAVIIPSRSTARIQEMHITLIHAVCGAVDAWWFAQGS